MSMVQRDQVKRDRKRRKQKRMKDSNLRDPDRSVAIVTSLLYFHSSATVFAHNAFSGSLSVFHDTSTVSDKCTLQGQLAFRSEAVTKSGVLAIRLGGLRIFSMLCGFLHFLLMCP